MSSFASEVKNELARLMYDSACCRRAELSGLLRMGGTLTLGPNMTLGLTFTSENAAVARKVLVLMKEIKEVTTEIAVRRSKRLSKRASYIVRVAPAANVREIIDDLGLGLSTLPTAAHGGKILKKSCCRMAYLRGAFLAGGSVNRPAAEYHMEFVTANYPFAELIQSNLRRIDYPAGLGERKDDFVVYMKEGDAIEDMLAIFGAEEAASEFEVTRNVKEVRNQVNRLVNCETANLNKTASASAAQITAIRRLAARQGITRLPKALRETARARLEHPEASVTELAKITGVSRSGLYHRLRKLSDMAGE